MASLLDHIAYLYKISPGTHFHIVLPFRDTAIKKFDWWPLMALGYGPLLGELSGFQESDVGIIHSLEWVLVSCNLADFGTPPPHTHTCPISTPISHEWERSSWKRTLPASPVGCCSSLWASHQQQSPVSLSLFTILQLLGHFPLMSHSSKMAALCDCSDCWELGHLAFKYFSG